MYQNKNALVLGIFLKIILNLGFYEDQISDGLRLKETLERLVPILLTDLFKYTLKRPYKSHSYNYNMILPY